MERQCLIVERSSVRWLARLLLVLGGTVSTQAIAEGAVRTLDCQVVRLCDASGSCVDESGSVVFRMEPVEVAADGSGRYRLQYGQTDISMTALSSAGPFVWTEDEERHTVLASSEQAFLWHRLTVNPEPNASIRFLICRFTQ